MNQQLKTYLDAQAAVIEAEVKEALELCGGDPMRALRVALIANAFLEMENERLTRQASTGYMRSRMPAKKT
jgi:hypothetical protein